MEALRAHSVDMKDAERPSPGKDPRRDRPTKGVRPPAPRGGRRTRGVQYTVRDVPQKVDDLLRRKAAEEQRSLNEVLKRALAKEAGLAEEPGPLYHDLDHLAGTWVEDPEFDAIIAEQDRVDEELWR